MFSSAGSGAPQHRNHGTSAEAIRTHKRSAENRTAKRAASWKRNQEAKAKRIAENEARRKANNIRRSQGLPTEYEERQAARRAAHIASKAR